MDCLPGQVELNVGDSIVVVPTFVDYKSNHVSMQLLAHEEIMDDIQKFCQESLAVKLNQQNVVSNALCLGKYSADNKWYRGLIKEVNSGTNMAKVLFLDYGNTESVCIQDGILGISDFLIGFVPFAYNCVWPKGTLVTMKELQAFQDEEIEVDVTILSSQFDGTTMLYTISIPELEEETRAVDKKKAGDRDQVDNSNVGGPSHNNVGLDQEIAVAGTSTVPTTTPGPRDGGQVEKANVSVTSTSHNNVELVQEAAVADTSTDLATTGPMNQNEIAQTIMYEMDNNSDVKNMLRRCCSEIVANACRKVGTPN